MSKKSAGWTFWLWNYMTRKNYQHFSGEYLLLALDGELSSREAAAVKSHLELCWLCRTRSEQLGKGIAEFVKYHQFEAKVDSSSFAGPRAMFIAQIEQVARSAGRSSLVSRIAGKYRMLRVFSQYEMPRPVWISALIIGAVTLVWLARLRETPRVTEAPKVSASQFLENAQASEVRALQSIARPVIYQKLRIRVGSQDVTRTIYRDRAGNRQADKLDVSNGRNEAGNGRSPRGWLSRPNPSQMEADLQRTFQRAGLNWQDPLSPASYRAWHDSLSEKQDEVIRDTDEFIALKTTTVDGPIAEASITARTADFHSVKEQLRLRDMRLVEISELDWDIMPFEVVNPAIFVVEAAPPPIAPRLSLRFPTGPTDKELAESELQARLALHAERADLGEEIELDRDTPNIAGLRQRALIVRGILGTPERKAELFAALRGIPHLELQLQTEEEAQALERQAAIYKAQGAATQPSKASDSTRAQDSEQTGPQGNREDPTSGDAILGKPLLNEQLEEHFPNAAERSAFVNRAVEIAESALSCAWALRHLQDRYTPKEVARLSYGSRHTLELLIRDDVSTLRRYLDDARTLFFPLLPPDTDNTELSAAQVSHAPLTSAQPVADWRSEIAEIFPEVRSIHRSVPVLFVRSAQADAATESLVRDLRSAINQLETHLPLLDQHITGSFLSETRQSAE
jgi:anti-sigma factor RsiW